MAKEFFGKYGKVGVATFLSAAIINYSLVYVAVKKGVNLRELADRYGIDVMLVLDTRQLRNDGITLRHWDLQLQLM